MRQYYLDGSEMPEEKKDREKYKLTLISEHDVNRDWVSFIHCAADSFWSQIDSNFFEKKSCGIPYTSVSFEQVCKNLCAYLSSLAKEIKSKKDVQKFFYEGRLYMYIEDFPQIEICINHLNQSFCVLEPSSTKIREFHTYQWKWGLEWLKECIKYLPLWETHKKLLFEKFYLNAKCVSISIISIRSLVKSVFAKEGVNYKMAQYYVESEIIFESLDHFFYYIKIYNKPFSKNPLLLIRFLENPHEEEISDMLNSKIISLPKGKGDSFNDYSFFALKDAAKIED